MYRTVEVSLVDQRCKANGSWYVRLIVMPIRSARLHEIKSVARSHQVAGTEDQLIILGTRQSMSGASVCSDAQVLLEKQGNYARYFGMNGYTL